MQTVLASIASKPAALAKKDLKTRRRVSAIRSSNDLPSSQRQRILLDTANSLQQVIRSAQRESQALERKAMSADQRFTKWDTYHLQLYQNCLSQAVYLLAWLSQAGITPISKEDLEELALESLRSGVGRKRPILEAIAHLNPDRAVRVIQGWLRWVELTASLSETKLYWILEEKGKEALTPEESEIADLMRSLGLDTSQIILIDNLKGDALAALGAASDRAQANRVLGFLKTPEVLLALRKEVEEYDLSDVWMERVVLTRDASFIPLLEYRLEKEMDHMRQAALEKNLSLEDPLYWESKDNAYTHYQLAQWAEAIALLGDRDYGLDFLRKAFLLHLSIAPQGNSPWNHQILYTLAEMLVRLRDTDSVIRPLTAYFQSTGQRPYDDPSGSEQQDADHLAISLIQAAPTDPAGVALVRYLLQPVTGRLPRTEIISDEPIKEQLRTALQNVMEQRLRSYETAWKDELRRFRRELATSGAAQIESSSFQHLKPQAVKASIWLTVLGDPDGWSFLHQILDVSDVRQWGNQQDLIYFQAIEDLLKALGIAAPLDQPRNEAHFAGAQWGQGLWAKRGWKTFWLSNFVTPAHEFGHFLAEWLRTGQRPPFSISDFFWHGKTEASGFARYMGAGVNFAVGTILIIVIGQLTPSHFVAQLGYVALAYVGLMQVLGGIVEVLDRQGDFSPIDPKILQAA